MRSRLAHLLALLLALVPFTMLCRVVWRNAVALPFSDAWATMPMMVDAFDGKLQFAQLWCLHNEHRIFFPRLVMIGLARATDYDVRYEQLASLAFAAGSFLVLSLTIRRVFGPRAPWLSALLTLAASFWLFSLTQWECWSWGFMLQMPLVVLAILSTGLVVSSWQWTWGRIVAVFLTAALGALSFGAGVVMLPLIPLVLALDLRRKESGGGARSIQLVVLTVALGVLGALCMPDAAAVTQKPYVPASIRARFALMVLGSAIPWEHPEQTFPRAVAGVALFVVSAGWLWSRGRPARAGARSWLLIGTHAVLIAALSGIARAESGLEAALPSRYRTMSQLFWIALAGLFALAVIDPASRLRPRLFVAVQVLLGALVCGASISAFAASWADSVGRFEERRDLFLHGLSQVRTFETATQQALDLVYTSQDAAREGPALLQARRLGPFAPPWRQTLSEYALDERPVDASVREPEVDAPPWEDCRVVRGCVRRKGPAGDVESVLVAIGTRVVAEADVEGDPAREYAAFALHVPVSAAPPGDSELTLVARYADSDTVAPLTGRVRLHVCADERFFMLRTSPDSDRSGPPERLRPLFAEGSWVLAARPEAEIVIAVPPDATRVLGRHGIARPWSEVGDGVRFTISVRSADGKSEHLFDRHLEPAAVPGDVGPQAFEVELPNPKPRELVLRTSNDPGRNDAGDVAYWTEVELR
jgi:hypothetical protein